MLVPGLGPHRVGREVVPNQVELASVFASAAALATKSPRPSHPGRSAITASRASPVSRALISAVPSSANARSVSWTTAVSPSCDSPGAPGFVDSERRIEARIAERVPPGLAMRAERSKLATVQS